MKRKYILVALSLVFSTLDVVFGQEAELGPKATTLSILYFDNLSKSPDFEWLRTGLSDMLTTDVAASGAVTVVEREKLAEVLKEQELQLSGAVKDDDAVRMGAILAAERIVYGSFIVAGQSLRIEARLVDTGSAAVLGAVSAEGKKDEALALERKIAAGILNSLGIPARVAPSSGGTSQPDAAAAYYRGLAALDSGAYREAQARFI